MPDSSPDIERPIQRTRAAYVPFSEPGERYPLARSRALPGVTSAPSGGARVGDWNLGGAERPWLRPLLRPLVRMRPGTASLPRHLPGFSVSVERR